MLSSIVDVGALWEAIWTATVAGLFVSVVFAFSVLGATRAADHRRDGRRAQAGAFAGVMVLGGVLTLGAAGFALWVIAS